MTPSADRLSCRIVELAVRVLPPDRRQRYARELVAELYGMSRTQQLRHALQVLTHALALRAVLRAAGPSTLQEDAMSTTARRPLRCRLRLHRWEEQENPETKERYEICSRCNAYRDHPSAAPGASTAGIFGGSSTF
ncbi:MAG TPA: hypothetical protein VGC37_12265 [Friedmanniella sp.]